MFSPICLTIFLFMNFPQFEPRQWNPLPFIWAVEKENKLLIGPKHNLLIWLKLTYLNFTNFGKNFGIIDLDLFALAGLFQLSSTNQQGNTQTKEKSVTRFNSIITKRHRNWYFFTRFGYKPRKNLFLIIKKVH